MATFLSCLPAVIWQSPSKASFGRNSVVLENLVERSHIEEVFGPAFQLFARRGLQPRQGFRVEGAEAFGKQALNDRCFALLCASLFAPLFAYLFALLDALLDAALGGEAFDAGDVAHFAFSFDDCDILPQLLFETVRQPHHPVQYGEQVEDALKFPSMRLAQANQSLFHT